MIPSPEQIRGRIATLVRVHMSRVRRPLLSAVVGIGAMAALGASRHGWSFESLLPWALGIALIAPIFPAFSLVREKSDGSLRYFASLPVAGAHHAWARTIVSALLGLPGGLLVAVTVHTMKPSLPSAVPIVGGIGVWLGATAISLALVAMQFRARIGQAATYGLYAVIGWIAIAKIIGVAAEEGWLNPLRGLLTTAGGLLAISVGVWVAIGAVGYVAFRSIARSSVSYRGEPVEA